MPNKSAMHLSPRCGARTRSGKPCRSAAMPNGRCRMHGGPSPGAPKGNKNALVHGLYTAEAVRQRKEISVLLRAARALAFHEGGSPNAAGMPCVGLILRFRSIPSPGLHATGARVA